MDLHEAIAVLERWQIGHPSRSIETWNNPVLGGVTAAAVTLEVPGKDNPPHWGPVEPRRIIRERRATTLPFAILALADSLA